MSTFSESQSIGIAMLIICGILMIVAIILCFSNFVRSLFSNEERVSKLEILTPRDESIVIVYENGTVILN